MVVKRINVINADGQTSTVADIGADAVNINFEKEDGSSSNVQEELSKKVNETPGSRLMTEGEADKINESYNALLDNEKDVLISRDEILNRIRNASIQTIDPAFEDGNREYKVVKGINLKTKEGVTAQTFNKQTGVAEIDLSSFSSGSELTESQALALESITGDEEESLFDKHIKEQASTSELGHVKTEAGSRISADNGVLKFDMGTGDNKILTQAEGKNYAPKSHAVSSTTYGKGTSANYGHVKLVDNPVYDNIADASDADNGVALSPKGGKTLVDAAIEKELAEGGKIIEAVNESKNELAIEGSDWELYSASAVAPLTLNEKGSTKNLVSAGDIQAICNKKLKLCFVRGTFYNNTDGTISGGTDLFSFSGLLTEDFLEIQPNIGSTKIPASDLGNFGTVFSIDRTKTTLTLRTDAVIQTKNPINMDCVYLMK